MKNYLLITIFVLFSTLSNAQIKGCVLNESAEPISGAVILIINSSDSTMLASTISGDEGVFSFVNKTDGSQLINISMLGYSSLTLPAKPEMGKIVMSTKVMEMGSVAVKGASFVASADKFTFTITNPNMVKGNNAIGILKLTPLLTVINGNISILGKTTKIFVNGREFKTGGIENYLSAIPAEDIIKIEVLPVANSTYSGQGGFGVINIVLRNNETNGVKGNVSLTDKQSFYNNQSLNATLNVRRNKVGIDASLWGNNITNHYELGEETTFMSRNNNIFSNTITKAINQNVGTRLGVDYNLTKRQVLGIMVYATVTNGDSKDDNVSHYGKIGSTTFDSTYNTNQKNISSNYNISANLNYQIQTDEFGSTFIADIDFTTYSATGKRYLEFNNSNKIGATQNIPNINSNNPQVINIWSGKLMYNKNFKKYGSLAFGLDNYTTSYDNKYIDNNSNFDNNNQFLFTEAITGLFASYNNSWTNKFSSSLGFRVENNYSKGHQLANNELFSKSKIRLIPTVHLNYAIHEDHNLSFVISEKLMYPGYMSLNPFKEYSSPTAYTIGNPFLQVSKMLISELTYMFKSKLMLQLVRCEINNNVNYITFQEGENGIGRKPLNSGSKCEYAINFGFYGSYFNGIWQANNLLALRGNTWKGSVDGISFDNKSAHWYLYLSNDFTLSKKQKLILGSYIWYQCRASSSATSTVAAHSRLDLSLRKQFKNFALLVYVNDIFNQYIMNTRFDHAGVVLQEDKNYNTREYGIRVSYRFGNAKTKVNRNRSTSNQTVNERL